MRLLWLILLLCSAASAQIDPEAARLFHVQAKEALLRLASFDLEAEDQLSLPATSSPRPRHILISFRRPNKELFVFTENSVKSTYVFSDNSVWADSGIYHKHGTRKAILRESQFLNPQFGQDMPAPERDNMTGAAVLREVNIQIAGKEYACKVIRVAFSRLTPAGAPTDDIETLWIDKKTGVTLRRERTSSYARAAPVTVAVTRFVTGDEVRPLKFDRTPQPGSVEDEGVIDIVLAALPLHGGDFVFKHEDGTPLTAPSLNGSPAILAFTTPGCTLCEQQLSAFNDAAKAVREAGGQAYRVAVNEHDAADDEALHDTAGTHNFGNASASAEQATRQGIRLFPALMVMTPHGTIYRTIQGQVTAEHILKLVEDAKAHQVRAPGEMIGMVRANTQGVVAPVATFKPPLTMPASARALGIEGTVRLGIVVLQNGTVRPDMSVITSSHPQLDALAVDYVRKWLFKPGTLDGKLANVIINVDIQFTKQ